MAISVYRAAEPDLPNLLTLLDLYYTEWDIWQRDLATAILADLKHPSLGFFLARFDGVPAGCVLCRPLPQIESAVECKRLFVVSEFRGHRIADLLMQEIESASRLAGMHWIYLDSKPEFATAIALYRRRGYQDCARYNNNAQATLFLRKNLSDPPSAHSAPTPSQNR
jgi:GNAT superfamily N-acetyltransferase